MQQAGLLEQAGRDHGARHHHPDDRGTAAEPGAGAGPRANLFAYAHFGALARAGGFKGEVDFTQEPGAATSEVTLRLAGFQAGHVYSWAIHLNRNLDFAHQALQDCAVLPVQGPQEALGLGTGAVFRSLSAHCGVLTAPVPEATGALDRVCTDTGALAYTGMASIVGRSLVLTDQATGQPVACALVEGGVHDKTPPSTAPTPSPTPAPTFSPTAYPTPYPTPFPTPFPTPYPTPFPTPYPDALPHARVRAGQVRRPTHCAAD